MLTTRTSADKIGLLRFDDTQEQDTYTDEYGSQSPIFRWHAHKGTTQARETRSKEGNHKDDQHLVFPSLHVRPCVAKEMLSVSYSFAMGYNDRTDRRAENHDKDQS
jgi:hypothetical protein